jgi:hypothetical protein
MIEDAIRAAINATTDEAARPRLRRCLPMLLRALAEWGGAPGGIFTMAIATPQRGLVLRAHGDWPQLAEQTADRKSAVALALVQAIETPGYQGDDAVAAIAALLGRAGLAAARADRERIAGRGRTPLVVALVEQDSTATMVLVTTVELVPPPVH